jgi:hypothetical protein
MRFLDGLPRYVFFTGKGGVGKPKDGDWRACYIETGGAVAANPA